MPVDAFPASRLQKLQLHMPRHGGHSHVCTKQQDITHTIYILALLQFSHINEELRYKSLTWLSSYCTCPV